MNLLKRQLITFLAIVETGSITSAAELLGLRKSSVSESLKQLEAEIGAKLLIRNTRRQSLTATGKEFYERGRALQLHAVSALEECRSNTRKVAGKIRIAAPPGIAYSKIAPVLSQYTDENPEILPELISTTDQIDLIGKGIDLSINVGPIRDSNYVMRRIGFVYDIIAGSSKIISEYYENIDCIDYKLPLIGYSWENERNTCISLVDSNMKPSGNEIRVQYRSMVNSIFSGYKLALEGHAAVRLSHFFAKDALETGRLEWLEAPNYCELQPIYAIHPYAESPPRAVRELTTRIEKSLRRECHPLLVSSGAK